MKLNGKIAVLTGASRGIGKAIATRLASEGTVVAINYRQDTKPAEALVTELNSRGFKAQAFRADVSKPTECQTLLDDVVKAFGRVDILASNAGIEYFGTLEEITPQDFERVFSVNVAGQLFVTQAAARYLTSGGRIVLTSSVSARISVFYHTLYAASKAAVSAMVLNLAPELGERGITHQRHCTRWHSNGHGTRECQALHTPGSTERTTRCAAQEQNIFAASGSARRNPRSRHIFSV